MDIEQSLVSTLIVISAFKALEFRGVEPLNVDEINEFNKILMNDEEFQQCYKMLFNNDFDE